MAEAVNPAPEPFEPFEPLGPDDPWREPIRLAYEQFPSLEGLDVAADVAALLARLRAVSLPTQSREAEFPALAPLGVGCAAALRRELDDALWLAPGAPNAKLTEWAVRRLGADRLPAADRRVLLTRTASVIRDLRAAAVTAELAGQDTRTGGRTLADAAGETALETVASQKSEATLLLAEASRELDELDPEMGELFLLSVFAGQDADALSALTGRARDDVKNVLADADAWARAQGRFLGQASGQTTSPPPRKLPPFASVLLLSL